MCLPGLNGRRPGAGPSAPVFAFLSVCALLLSVAPSAQAEVIYQTGFEPTTFGPGTLTGQDGWQDFPPDPGGVVQTTTVAGGTQAVQLSLASGGYRESFWSVNRAVGSGSLVITVDFMRTQSGVKAGFGGLSVWGDTGFLGQIQVLDIAEVQLGNHDSNGARLAFSNDVWHVLRLDFDFASLTFTGSVDGVSLGSLVMNPEFGAPTQITDVVFYGYGLDDGQDLFYDNLVVSGDLPPAAVPLPATLALLGLGLLAIRRRAGARA